MKIMAKSYILLLRTYMATHAGNKEMAEAL
jgi:hypothetical protein